jgi:TolB protein
MHNYYFPPAPSSTPWAPAWSPDGKSIAVAMSGSIWKVDPASGVAHEVTYDGKYHSMPAWSPDGNWIVYTADDGGKTLQLAIVNVATGESKALTNDAFIYTDPVFSPDSTVSLRLDEANSFFSVMGQIKSGRWAGDGHVSTDTNPQLAAHFGVEDLHHAA